MSAGLLLGVLVSPSAHGKPVDDWQPNLRDCPLPSPLKERFESSRSAISDDVLRGWLFEHRFARPEVYAATAAPPADVALVPDYAPMNRLHVALPGWEDHDETYVALLSAASHHGRVRASVMWPADVPRIRSKLKQHQAVLAAIEFVYDDPVETIWMRDYGPIPVTTSKGLGVVDFSFAPDCVENDAHPTRTAPTDRPVWRSDLLIEAGNLMADEHGTCFATTDLLESTGRTENDVADALRTWAGCQRLLLLEPLVGSAAPHIDVLLTPAPGDVLLLASVDPTEDPVNHAVMVSNRRRLEQAKGPWTLVDLPMPPPVSGPGGTLVRRTWNNLLPFNGVVLIPDYSHVPTERVVLAWNRIAAAFPGRELKAIPSDRPIEDGGSVHCLTRAEP